MRKKYDLALGDTVTFKQNGKTFALPIAAFERSSFGETVYCGYDFAENYAIIEHIGYNGLYTTSVCANGILAVLFGMTAIYSRRINKIPLKELMAD